MTAAAAAMLRRITDDAALGNLRATVAVYRDDDVVTVVGRATHEAATPSGPVRSVGTVVTKMSLATYERIWAAAMRRAPLAFSRIMGQLRAAGVAVDARGAPPTPRQLKDG